MRIERGFRGLLVVLAGGCHAGSSGEATKPVEAAAPPPPAPVVSAAPASTYRVRPVTGGHAVEVRVTNASKARPPRPIPAEFASHCGGASTVADSSVEVDAKGGVTGAVVWIDDLHEGAAPSSTPAVLDQRACAFTPHVLAMTAGAPLALTNGDPANHAVRLDFVGGPEETSVVKIVPPGGRDTIATSPAWAGRVARVTCPIHPWMLGWARFFDTPYFAVTQGGVARIPDVPQGAWHVSVWHEGLATDAPPNETRVEANVRDRDVMVKLVLGDDGTMR